MSHFADFFQFDALFIFHVLYLVEDLSDDATNPIKSMYESRCNQLRTETDKERERDKARGSWKKY